LLIKQIIFKSNIMERTRRIETLELKEEVPPEVVTQTDAVIQPETGPRKIRYQKIGGGSLRLSLDGKQRIIKPGEKFLAYPEEVSDAFKRWIKPLEDVPVIPDIPLNVVNTTFKIVPRGDDNLWFDIVDAQGKVMNSKALHKDKAEILLKELM
jgi:hypothetical protein